MGCASNCATSHYPENRGYINNFDNRRSFFLLVPTFVVLLSRVTYCHLLVIFINELFRDMKGEF